MRDDYDGKSVTEINLISIFQKHKEIREKRAFLFLIQVKKEKKSDEFKAFFFTSMAVKRVLRAL